MEVGETKGRPYLRYGAGGGLVGTSYVRRLERIKKEVEKGLEEDFSSQDLEKFRVILDMIDDELVEEYNRGNKRRITISRKKGKFKLNARRTEIEVLASILDVARYGVNKTKILYKANLSYTQLRNYLLFLGEKGLLRVNKKANGGSTYLTTPKGLLFLSTWGRIVPLLE